MIHYLKCAFVSFLVLTAIASFAQQSNNRNYIITQTFKQSGANANDVSKVTTELHYLDGLGRPLQNVLVKQSPSGDDVVQPVEFDATGRQPKAFLPYANAGNGAFQINAAGNAAAWYTANTAGIQATDLTRPYHESFFEKSPSGRLTGERAAGGKSVKSAALYKASCCGEIRRYDYDKVSNTIKEFAGGYVSGRISYTQQTDEQGNVSYEYTDLMGRVVCRQIKAAAGNVLSTYFVFDDLGLLRGVLQPAYQDSPSLADHAFTYDYDFRGRMIVQRIPGGGMTEIVYDQYNRPALSRDAGQLARGVWGFTKYDGRNRPVVTGEISSALSRADWAAAVDANALHHEERANGTLAGYSLDKTAPKTATEVNLLTITFYDDYAFSKAANLGYTASYYPSSNTNVKGYPTGGRSRLLPGAGGTGSWLSNVVYYDTEYRPIQTIRELHDLGAGAIERISTKYKYDLAPVTDELKTEQLLPGNVTNTLLSTYSYDHADRLLSVKEKLTGGGQTAESFTLAQRYNALGHLKSKWFHSSDNQEYLRRTDYTYNIRDWLTEGKTIYKENGPELPFYGFSLTYLNGANYTNGNVSQIQWQEKDQAAFTKGMSFSYDGADRLTGSAGIGGYADLESGITYDKNGNIKTLKRAGSAVDNLTYTYTGNRLSTITDASGNNLGVKNGLSSYTHDANGNMTTDGNRGATLTYNYLNLPKTVKIGASTMTYDYDASGVKHEYVSDTLTLKYAGVFEYRVVGSVNQLYRVGLSEGQAVFKAGKPQFNYYLKDHLGNVRVVFDSTGSILQRTDYYAFGLAINRDGALPKVQNWVNRYHFLRKETQVGSNYIDLQARFYDSAIGRFTTVDPMAEKGRRWSPYAYGFNNPLRFIDPDGMWPEDQGDDPFLIARLVTTAFYDTKHAIINTGARLLGSDIRAGYKTDNKGNQTFETEIYRQSVDNSLGGVVREAVNTVADVALVATAGSSPANPGNLLSKTIVESQVVKAGKEAVNETAKAGIKTASGIEVTGFVRHGMNRIIERGVKPSAILDALKNPLKTTQVATDATGRQSQRFVGQFGAVVINPQTGKIISANPTSTRRAANLLKKSEQ